MQCKEIMTDNPAFCLPNDFAQKAALMMQEHICGLLPVVDSEYKKQPIGMVTDRDLCLTVVGQGRDPKLVHVEECMTKSTISCRPEDDVVKCLDLMKQNKIRRLAVCDAGGKLVGVIALADIVLKGKIPHEKAFEALRDISEPTDQPSKPRSSAVA